MVRSFTQYRGSRISLKKFYNKSIMIIKLPKEIIINILFYLDNFKDVIKVNKYIYNLFLENKNYIGILKLKPDKCVSLDKHQKHNDYYKIWYYLQNNTSNYVYTSINLVKFLYYNKKILLNYHEINDTLNALIQTDNIQVLKFFLEIFDISCYNCNFSIYIALLCGNLNVIKTLVEKYRILFDSPLMPAILGEQSSTVYYLLNQGFEFDSETIHTAAFKGQLELVKHLLNLGCAYTDDILVESLKENRNDMSFWIINNLKVNVTKECVDIAVRNSNTPILYLFYKMKILFSNSNLNDSLIRKDDIVTLFLINKCKVKISKRSLELSLIYSNESMIFYLLHNPESDKILSEHNILPFAIEKCSINVIKYLILDKNQSINKGIYINCIYKNREDLFDFLVYHHNLENLDKNLMRIAIVKGNFNIVKILHKRLKVLSPVFIHLALRHHHKDIANYLKQ